MNFLAGFVLIMSEGNEEEAFWQLIFMARSQHFLIMGLFEDNFPLL